MSFAERNHKRPVVVPDHFRNFKRIQSIVVTTSKIEEYLSVRERKLLFEIEKRKVKRLLKITILDEQEPSVQSADKTKAVQI